jgi:cobalt-zinc-cadmium efflux system membrane fusion protein
MTIGRGATLALSLILGILLYLACTPGDEAGPAKEKEVSAEKSTPQEEKPGLIILDPEAQERAEIMIEDVSFRPLKLELQFPGTIRANETKLAHVGSRIQGRIVKVMVGLGDYVGKGEGLAVIDSPELGQAQSEYLSARARLVVAEKGFERAKALVEGKVIGTGEFQRREGDYILMKEEVRAAENRLILLGMTEWEVGGLGRERFIRAHIAITSPFSGTVIEQDTATGEVVEPVKTLFTIADLSILWGIADIPEKDLAKIKKGLTTEVLVSAYPQGRFRGKITYLSDTIDPSSRTLKVRIEVENPKGRLKPEMFASFRILTEETEKILTVPVLAVQREGEKSIVFVSHQGKGFEKRAVELGPEVQGYYPVLSGLQQGEKIVTKGAFILKSETMKGLMEEE